MLILFERIKQKLPRG